MKPTPATKVLRHGQFIGIHVLIKCLNSTSDLDVFMSYGTRAHIFGPRKDSVYLPYLSVFILRVLNGNFELCLVVSFN